jgi:hypothetical protein
MDDKNNVKNPHEKEALKKLQELVSKELMMAKCNYFMLIPKGRNT